MYNKTRTPLQPPCTRTPHLPLPTEGSDPRDVRRSPIEWSDLSDLVSALLQPPKVRVPGRRREDTMDPIVYEVRPRRRLRPTPPPHRNGAWNLPLPLPQIIPQTLRAGVLPRE